MATLVIPLITTLGIPLAEKAITDAFPLVAKLMDKLFGKGTGPTIKMPAGTTILQALMAEFQKNLAGTGIGVPTDAKDIQATLQAVVDDLKSKGLLVGTDTVLDHPPVGVTNSTPVASPNRALLMSALALVNELVKAGA